MLLPLGQATLLLAAIGKRLGILPRIGAGVLLVSLLNPLVAAAFGSRSSLFLLAVEALAAALLLVPRITARHVVWTGAVAVILLVSSSLIFASRLEFLGMDYRLSARYSVYTITVPANADYLDLLDSAHGSIGPLLASAVSLLQYFIHGVFEFFYLVELKSDNFTYGDTIFFFVSKMTSYLTGGATALSTLEIDARNPRGGTFQSFYRPGLHRFRAVRRVVLPRVRGVRGTGTTRRRQRQRLCVSVVCLPAHEPTDYSVRQRPAHVRRINLADGLYRTMAAWNVVAAAQGQLMRIARWLRQRSSCIGAATRLVNAFAPSAASQTAERVAFSSSVCRWSPPIRCWPHLRKCWAAEGRPV